MVPSDAETTEFSTMATPRVVVDDPVRFPNVARIVDVMLRHVDP